MTLAYPQIASRLYSRPLLATRSRAEEISAAYEIRRGRNRAEEVDADAADDVPDRTVEHQGGIAVVPVFGTLVHRHMSLMDAMSGFDSTEDVKARIQAELDDGSVEGVLLEIDSPGGEVAGIQELGELIFEGRKKKPIVALVNELAASAGYWIASAADQIVTPKTGILGSIGVVAMHVDQSRLNEKVGIKPEFVFAGEKKVDGHPHAPLSDRARADLQAEIDRLYDLFTETVGRNRGPRFSAEAARATEAGIFTGEEAVSRGLADQIGGKAQAMAALQELIESREANAMNVVKIDRDELEGLRAKAATAEGLQAQLDQQGKTLAELQKTVDAYKAERATRAAAERAAVVDQLVADCKAAGVTPPEKAERDQILAALEAHEETGRLYASAVRERCLAATTAKAGTTVKPIQPEQSDEAKKQAEFAKKLAAKARAPQTTKA